MSCYIMNHDNIREIGYTLADCLNHVRMYDANDADAAIDAPIYKNCCTVTSDDLAERIG